MLNHPMVGTLIQEKDRPALMYLQDVTCKLHDQSFGFDILFSFEKNDYFSNAVLKKSYTMSRQNIIEKCEGTTIEWNEGKNITEKKVKKKNKKSKKTETKTVEQESFFNFFKTVEMPDAKDLENIKEEEERELGSKMDEDFELGNEFKDQLIPLALEYYMEVIDE
jgi:nucleosome assembly protein 1-like 1